MSSNTNLAYEGTVIYIGQTETISDKFSKRQIVVSDKTSEYPQEICFEFNQSKCADLDNINIGDQVKISYNLRGKLWKDNKWFNSLNGWKIEKVGSSPSHNNTGISDKLNPPSNVIESDDLPF